MEYLEISACVQGLSVGGELGITLDECKNRCDDRDDCKSFIYSQTKQLCILKKVSAPNSPNCLDFLFCIKTQGNKLTMIVLYM